MSSKTGKWNGRILVLLFFIIAVFIIIPFISWANQFTTNNLSNRSKDLVASLLCVQLNQDGSSIIENKTEKPSTLIKTLNEQVKDKDIRNAVSIIINIENDYEQQPHGKSFLEYGAKSEFVNTYLNNKLSKHDLKKLATQCANEGFQNELIALLGRVNGLDNYNIWRALDSISSYKYLNNLIVWIIAIIVIILILTFIGRLLLKQSEIEANIPSICGVMFSSRRHLSLSQFQVTLWVIILASGYITLFIMRCINGVQQPLNIKFDGDLLMLMGISAGSFLTSKFMLQKQQDAGGVRQLRAREKNESLTFSKVVRDLFTSDYSKSESIISENEPNTAKSELDIAKIQMFAITILTAIPYVIVLVNTLLSTNPHSLSELPQISDGFAILLAMSHGGYLTSKNS